MESLLRYQEVFKTRGFHFRPIEKKELERFFPKRNFEESEVQQITKIPHTHVLTVQHPLDKGSGSRESLTFVTGECTF